MNIFFILPNALRKNLQCRSEAEPIWN